MVTNMGKNVARIEEYFKLYQTLEGAAAIEVKNQMEAYFISLDLEEQKLDKLMLQK